jgi:hypothetical protein
MNKNDRIKEMNKNAELFKKFKNTDDYINNQSIVNYTMSDWINTSAFEEFSKDETLFKKK